MVDILLVSGFRINIPDVFPHYVLNLPRMYDFQTRNHTLISAGTLFSLPPSFLLLLQYFLLLLFPFFLFFWSSLLFLY